MQTRGKSPLACNLCTPLWRPDAATAYGFRAPPETCKDEFNYTTAEVLELSDHQRILS